MTAFRRSLEVELERVIAEEDALNSELSEFFATISGSSNSTEISELSATVSKIEAFSPHFEGMVQNSKKLSLQVDDCHALSDRVSVMVRRLDTMQLRAQQALACTEDILTLKDCRKHLQDAMDARDLVRAVDIVKQVKKISPEAAATSDDYAKILEQESIVKELVQTEFTKAIESSNTTAVMALCPLLQTLGLETTARDQFLDFVEEHVFIAVTADEAAAGSSTDATQGYMTALSSVFNAAHLILQKYLPMVIAGMENSFGDVHFIERLHSRCAKETGTVLKRYMKFRKVRDIVTVIQRNNGGDKKLATQEIHILLDELALLAQYCSKYSRYIRDLCEGAHARDRPHATKYDRDGNEISLKGENADTEAISPQESAKILFPGPLDFDKMTDELISRYYMEAEKWVMNQSVRSLNIFSMAERGAFSSSAESGFAAVLNTPGATTEMGSGIDECFYVLQRCGLRAVATNNIHAACATLHFVSDLLSSELLTHLTEVLNAATDKVTIAMVTNVSKYIAQIRRNNRSFDQLDKTFLSGYQSAIALASTIGSSSSNTTSSGGGDYSDKIKSYMRSTGEADIAVDAYGVADCAEVFNVMGRCSRYVKRLGEEVVSAGQKSFGSTQNQNMQGSSQDAANKKGGSGDAELLALCRQDFLVAQQHFEEALEKQYSVICDSSKNIMHDLLTKVLGHKGILGGIRFDIPDEKFDEQPALSLLPNLLVKPIEIMLEICISELSEGNKNKLLELLINGCCERIEHFILQNTFRFAGALKFEECIRAVITMCGNKSETSMRAKFSRLREVLMVLTSDVRSISFAESLSQLTPTEAQAVIALRLDAVSTSVPSTII
eukprot:GSChrysophyteH1.ASY1.ANO1.2739.1 assembled CDS